MERIAMSQEGRNEITWIARKMGVRNRWVRTLLKRMSKRGDAVVLHGLRGRPSNRKLAAETQRGGAADSHAAGFVNDFGPTFAAEQLAQRHQIEAGKETLRGWMIEAGLWKPRSRRLQAVAVARRSALAS